MICEFVSTGMYRYENVRIIPSVVYCIGCEESGREDGGGGGGGGELNKFLAPKRGTLLDKGAYLRGEA